MKEGILKITIEPPLPFTYSPTIESQLPIYYNGENVEITEAIEVDGLVEGDTYTVTLTPTTGWSCFTWGDGGAAPGNPGEPFTYEAMVDDDGGLTLQIGGIVGDPATWDEDEENFTTLISLTYTFTPASND